MINLINHDSTSFYPDEVGLAAAATRAAPAVPGYSGPSP